MRSKPLKSTWHFYAFFILFWYRSYLIEKSTFRSRWKIRAKARKTIKENEKKAEKKRLRFLFFPPRFSTFLLMFLVRLRKFPSTIFHLPTEQQKWKRVLDGFALLFDGNRIYELPNETDVQLNLWSCVLRCACFELKIKRRKNSKKKINLVLMSAIAMFWLLRRYISRCKETVKNALPGCALYP